MASGLPLEKMSEDDFLKLKNKYLDNKVLSEEALSEISRLFAIGEESTGVVHCNEAHAHSYECVYFRNPKTGIAVRLIEEIRRYKDKIERAKTELSD